MTNTIPNVPRELLLAKFENWHNEAYGPQGEFNPVRSLDRWPEGTGLGYQDNTVQAQFFAFCGALALSAPSPAGVEGCKCSMSISMLGDGCRHCQPQEYIDRIGEMLDEERSELSDAQAIIDGLRGEVGAQRVKTCTALKERNDAREERDAAATECERLRMQLAACGVVALANTIESAGEARQMHPDYMSASCSDVAGAVDREIALRAERDRHAQRIGELEGLLRDCYPGCGLTARQTQSIRERIDAALSAGKEGE